MTKKNTIPRALTPEDRKFVRMVADGERRAHSFRKAYPNHPKVKRYMDIVTGKEEPKVEDERKKLALSINVLAKEKAQAKYIKRHLENFSEAMDVLASKGIIVANEILDNGRSEKVKADLAIEFIRHKVGAPTVKVQQQIDKTVNLTFGAPPERDDMSDIIEGEIV